MASQDDINHQRNLLEINRRNLAHYLRQRDTLGEAYTPPGTLNGVLETRDNIQRIKGILSGWNVPADDHPDDREPPASERAAAQTAPPVGGPTYVFQGGTFSGPIGQVGGSSVSSVFNQEGWNVAGNVYNIARDMNVSTSSSKD